MNKRNIVLTTLVIAAIIAALFQWLHPFRHSAVAQIIYFPSVFLAVVVTAIFSHPSHEPQIVAFLISYVVYTIFYWGILLIAYALRWEAHLIEQGLERSGIPDTANPDPTVPDLALVGRAVRTIESRRRHHFLLAPEPSIDLTAPAEKIGADALAATSHLGPMRRLTNRLRGRLIKQGHSPERAQQLIQNLKVSARGGEIA